ncbi:MAG: phage terminase large subunit [Brevinema sp.]
MTGRGGNFIIIDDPIKPQDALSDTKRKSINQWYANTLYSRLDNKNTDVIIIVMQRVHTDDLCSFVQENEDWEVLNLPAIATKDEAFELSNGKTITRRIGEILNPQLESQFILENIKKNTGSYNFEAHLRPAEPNSCRGRLLFPDLKRKVVELYGRYSPKELVIENKSSGMALIQQLEQEHQIYPIKYEPKLSKKDRIMTNSGVLESGRILLPRGGSFLDALRTEVVTFPNGKHDDQLDALSQILDRATDRSSYGEACFARSVGWGYGRGGEIRII